LFKHMVDFNNKENYLDWYTENWPDLEILQQINQAIVVMKSLSLVP